MGKQLTTEKIIERFKNFHGDKYDYSKVEYVDTKTKIEIICPVHGAFWQNPVKHKQGQGCPKCCSKKFPIDSNITTEKIIERLKRFLCTVSLCNIITFFGAISYNTLSSGDLSNILHNYNPKVGNGFGELSINKIIEALHQSNVTVIKMPSNLFLLTTVASAIFLIWYAFDINKSMKRLNDKLDEYQIESNAGHRTTHKLITKGNSDGKKIQEAKVE